MYTVHARVAPTMRDCSRMYRSGSTCPVKVAESVRSLEYLSINSKFSRFRDLRGYCKQARGTQKYEKKRHWTILSEKHHWTILSEKHHWTHHWTILSENRHWTILSGFIYLPPFIQTTILVSRDYVVTWHTLSISRSSSWAISY